MLKLLSLFSGIGAFEKALEHLKVPFELVNYCEIDKYASKAYSLVHDIPEEKNLGDITKVDTSKFPQDIDILTYGFPCTDISQAGKQKGFIDENGNQTRSGLFFDALRIIQDTKPKYAIAENVKALTSDKFKTEFKTVLGSLSKAGYSNYYKVLNSKDFGIPQNRERIFIVSIRKDIDDGFFSFPLKQELKLRLKDMLESEVDEKYYLKETKDFFIRNSLQEEKKGNGFRFAPHVKDKADMAYTITTHAGGRMHDNFIIDNENITDKSTFTFNSENTHDIGNKYIIYDDFNGHIRNDQDTIGTLTTKIGCSAPRATYKIIEVAPKRLGNIYGEQFSTGFAGNVYAVNGISPTLLTVQGGNATPLIPDQLRIRKLTPKECWRLMGFDDNDIQKCMDAGISNAQLYKMAGNSIVVNVLESLFREILGI